ncbi:hypothetical protein V1460_21685 [Streptomyces sp. SCSIO 30461]|uniref:hypothetical protein n=1 Tax=Streptomyces sp. SCSIO 30461 TaxID=3118085 RepID=UPI0030CE0899
MPFGSGPGVADCLGAYTRDRLPRTMGIVRLATRTGRMALHDGAVGVVVRDALISAVPRFGPGLVLRAFDGIADRQPPARPYPAGEAPRYTGARADPKPGRSCAAATDEGDHGEGRLHRARGHRA